MGAEIERLSSAPGVVALWLVTCPEHGLSRTVSTEQHATNIAQLHDRIDHAADDQPPTFDITAAARAALDLQRGAGGDAAEAALDVFGALIGEAYDGSSDDSILAAAERYAAEPTTAHPAPF